MGSPYLDTCFMDYFLTIISLSPSLLSSHFPLIDYPQFSVPLIFWSHNLNSIKISYPCKTPPNPTPAGTNSSSNSTPTAKPSASNSPATTSSSSSMKKEDGTTRRASTSMPMECSRRRARGRMRMRRKRMSCRMMRISTSSRDCSERKRRESSGSPRRKRHRN